MRGLEVAERQAPSDRVDFGRGTVRWRRAGLRFRMDLRTVVVCGLIAAATLAVALASLATGDFRLDPLEVIQAVFAGDGFAHTVVVEWRMPRVVAAIVFGAALGLSGAVFQSITRNPLASPDIIGFTAGSFTGALVVILAIGASYAQVAGGALVGGLATAAVVYVLAYARGVQGFRLIVVGIGISAMLTSANTYLVMVSDHDAAVTATVWGVGSLNATTWEQAALGTAVVFALVACLVTLSRPLKKLELGDDAAKALGVRVEPARLGLVVVGVALVATVTAAAGPIAFVALAAPQIGMRLARTPGVALLPAAFMGAFILCASDYVAQHLLPTAMPVGIVTVVVGGTYLVWLLVSEARRRL